MTVHIFVMILETSYVYIFFVKLANQKCNMLVNCHRFDSILKISPSPKILSQLTYLPVESELSVRPGVDTADSARTFFWGVEFVEDFRLIELVPLADTVTN